MKSVKTMLKAGLLAGTLATQMAGAPQARAHGEDKPGPNGGEIRMPGTFHTEVKGEKGFVVVHLLDIEFKNPAVESSSVKAIVRRDGKETSLSCAPEKTAFKCALPKGESLKSGELVVTANRSGNQGAETIYALPLKFGSGSKPSAVKEKAKSPTSGHDHGAHGHGGHGKSGQQGGHMHEHQH